tara:strand:- start:4123 stop:4653 length:531 start_codon:yes stop_codon:yes gene_type:complete
MFFYLLKNSTIIDINLSDSERNTKIIIYGCICYIVLHATLFIGGKDALLYSLKPYFWLFLILDLTVNYINHTKEVLGANNSYKSAFKSVNSVFDSFLKKKDIDGNSRGSNISNTNDIQNCGVLNNAHNMILSNQKNKNVKRVRFHEPNTNGYYSSSDSDIGTDIDLDSFKESLDNL